MSDKLRRFRAGAIVAGCMLSVLGSAALAQTNVKNPSTREDPKPQYPKVDRHYPQGGVRVDPIDGSMSGPNEIVQPVFIPEGGFFPSGTLPQIEREAGRPMRPGDDPWIPDGTGFKAPGFEDRPGLTYQPLMQDHEGPGYNGLTPPDPDLARGLDYQVCVTNDDFAVYDSCGNQLFYSDINDFLGLSDFLFDPKVIFDPWSLRWVMMYHIQDTSPQTSRLVYVISGDEKPFGIPGATYWYYNTNMLQDAGTGDASWADYFDLGYSNSAIYAAGNMFRFAGGFRWGRIIVWDKAAMYSGGGAGGWQWWNLTNADGSQTNTPRAAKMQTSWSENPDGNGNLNVDAYCVNSRWGGGDRITFWKVRSFLTNNYLTKADTVVADYTTPPDAVQPNGSTLDTIDCRLMTAVVAHDVQNGNGIELFTSLNTARGSDAACRLYKFDAVSHAAEMDQDFFSTGWDYWFASSAADYSGSNFWVFCRTQNAAGGEPELRFVETNKGTFSNSSNQIIDGTGSYSGFRWGDYQGGQLDWGDYYYNGGSGGQHKVWLYGEYGKAGNTWGTHAGASSVFGQGSVSSVSPAGAWVINGPPGGPFAPNSQLYTLGSASGDTGTAYSVTSLPTWLSADNTYGQIWTSASVTLSVNSNANGLGLGTYNDSVFFNDCFSGGSSYSRAVQLNVQAPDLEVLSCLVNDGNFNPGDIVNVSGQYRNNGNVATGAFQADFYASTNTTISPADTLLGSRVYGSLGAGATMNFGVHSLTLPCMPQGNRYIGVIVTVTNDADTSDNTGYDPVAIGYAYCPGDFNGDCSVNALDFLAFLNAWNAHDPRADCNGDTMFTALDFLCFLNLYNSGC